MKIATLFFCLLFAPAASAYECTQLAKVSAGVHLGVPTAVITEFSKTQTENFLKVWNAVPPETDINADAISVVIAPDKPNILILIFKKGCFGGMYAMTKNAFTKLAGQSL